MQRSKTNHSEPRAWICAPATAIASVHAANAGTGRKEQYRRAGCAACLTAWSHLSFFKSISTLWVPLGDASSPRHDFAPLTRVCSLFVRKGKKLTAESRCQLRREVPGAVPPKDTLII